MEVFETVLLKAKGCNLKISADPFIRPSKTFERHTLFETFNSLKLFK